MKQHTYITILFISLFSFLFCGSMKSQNQLAILQDVSTEIVLPSNRLHCQFPPFALKTNLLFDLVSALNVEVEVPISKRFSVATDWVFPWWTLDNGCANSKRSRLQVLNGNLEGRYWFGNREQKRLLNGWFAGFYAGGGLYDF